MKKLAILFVSVLTLGLSISCDKDEDEASIEGSWELLKEGVIVNGQEVFNPYENSCSTKKDYIELLSNGTLKDISYNVNCSESIDNGTWTKNGNTLTITYAPDESNALEILELTSTKLKVKSFDEEEQIYYLFELQRK